jgi:hypothetical protein
MPFMFSPPRKGCFGKNTTFEPTTHSDTLTIVSTTAAFLRPFPRFSWLISASQHAVQVVTDTMYNKPEEVKLSELFFIIFSFVKENV